MRLFVCEHPRVITNPYTQERVSVPCGKCSTCRNARAFKWITRLELERSSHPYCVFFTLTYKDKYVPKVYYSKSEDCFRDSDGNIVCYLNDLKNEKKQHFDLKSFTAKDWAYLYNARVFYVHDYSDVQNFVKRLRNRVYENEANVCKNHIRYYIVGEFGETTYRPHYHGLLFFDSPWLAKNAASVISSCWTVDGRYSCNDTLGTVDVQHVASSASSYVASYLNSYGDLPKVYQCSQFRPRALFSRSPTIGSLYFDKEKVVEIFSSGACTCSVYDRKHNQYVQRPLPNFLETRLYPRFKGFGSIDDSCKFRIYKYLFETKSRSYKDFLDETEKYCLDYDNTVSEYLRKVACSPSAFTRLYSIANRLRYNFMCLPVISTSDYFNKILNYYENKKSYLLCQQLKMEKDYSRDPFKDPYDLCAIDMVSYQDSFDYPDKYERMHESYVTLYGHDLPDYTTLPSYVVVSSTNQTIEKNNKYSRKKNDYLERNQKTDVLKLIYQLYGK